MLCLTKTYHIDTAPERVRLHDVFKKDPKTLAKLIELMDAIDEGDWLLCYDLLDSDWWRGRDEKAECSRLEFIGEVNTTIPNQFSEFYSYLDLLHDIFECGTTKCEVVP